MRTFDLPPELDASIAAVKNRAEAELGNRIDVADDVVLRLKCRSRIRENSLAALPADAAQSVYALSDKTDDESVREVVHTFPNLMELHVPSGRSITDAACDALGTAAKVRGLSFRTSRVSDAGAAAIAGLPDLRSLWLTNAQLSDDGLRSIALAPDVYLLALDGNFKILGPGLEAFAGNQTLQFLFLSGTKVGDEHIAHLSGCTSLMRIMLSSTNVTEECVLSLPRNHDCEVFLPEGLEGERLNEIRKLRPELIVNGIKAGSDTRELDLPEGEAPAELPRAIRSDSPTLVLFTAPWCEPCKWVKTAIDKVPIGVRERFRYVEVDVEADPETASTMRVQSLPTLMFIDRGRERTRLIGAHKAPAIEEQMRALLA